VRDLHGQLDVITDGLFGSAYEFAMRYCDAQSGPYGLVANGRSNEAELIERLSFVKIQRPRREIWAEMPTKTRQIFWIDAPAGSAAVRRRQNGTPRGSLCKMIEKVAPIKRPYVVANVMNELAEGLKVYVLTFRRNACEALGRALNKEVQKRVWRSRMQAQNVEVWIAQTQAGVNSKLRKDMARAFQQHQGAGVFVATMDSMPGGVSLKGATNIHMTDFHTKAGQMAQAETRVDADKAKIHITHYVVKNSIDEHFEAVVIPKFEAQDKLTNDENAQHMLSAFRLPSEEETIEEVWARHTAHLHDDDDDD